MDYMKFVEYHRDQGADITVGCLPVDYERASDFGLMHIDDQGVVTVSDMLTPCGILSAVACTVNCSQLVLLCRNISHCIKSAPKTASAPPVSTIF